MNNESLREKFETYALKVDGYLYLSRYPDENGEDGEYKDDVIQAGWECYQQGYAQALIDYPPIPSDPAKVSKMPYLEGM